MEEVSIIEQFFAMLLNTRPIPAVVLCLLGFMPFMYTRRTCASCGATTKKRREFPSGLLMCAVAGLFVFQAVYTGSYLDLTMGVILGLLALFMLLPLKRPVLCPACIKEYKKK